MRTISLKKVKRYLPRRHKHILFIFVLLVCHVLLANTFIPYSNLFDEKYSTTTDYPYRQYNIHTARELAYDGKLEGFDPFLLSSFPTGLIKQDNLVPKTLSLILYFIPDSAFYEGYSLLLYLLAPFIIYASVRNFGFNRNVAIISVALGIIAQRFVIYHDYYLGSNDFVFASHLVLLCLAFFFNYSKSFHLNKLIKAGLLFLFSLLLYPLSFVMLMPSLIIIYLKKDFLLKNFLILLSTKGKYLLLLLIPTFVIFIHYFNSYIIKVISGFKAPDYFKGFLSVLSHFKLYVPLLFLLLAIEGILVCKNKHFKHFIIYSLLFYFFCGFLLSYIDIFLYMRFYRLSRVFLLFLVVPASLGLYTLIYRKNKPLIKRLFISILIIITLMNIFFLPFNIVDQIKWRINQKISSDLPPNTEKLIAWIKENTNKSSRILVEQSGIFTQYFYGNGVITPILVKRTNKLFAASNFPYGPNLLKRSSSPPHFVEANMFGDYIHTYKQKHVEKIFQVYNIKWVIIWSDDSKKFFREPSSHFKLIKQIGPYSIYTANIKPSYFLKGQGEIKFDYGKIKIINATKNCTIINQPFITEIDTIPDLKLDRYLPKKLSIPFGFIKVHNGNISNFTIKTNKK